MPVPKKMRLADEKFGGESDHQSDGEEGVQPMMTKIKTVLKSEWWICLFQGWALSRNLQLNVVSLLWGTIYDVIL